MARTHEAQTLSEIFSLENATYTKIVAGFTIPVTRRYSEGYTLTAIEALALSAYALERKGSVANSNIDRGSWKDKSDAEKVELTRDYLNGGDAFTDNIGGTFGTSLLMQAALNVLYAANEAALTKAGYASVADAREKLEPAAVKMLNDPGNTEKYHDKLTVEMQRILGEKHAKRTRKSGSDDAIEIEV